MLTGVLVGYLFRNVGWLRRSERVIPALIFMLVLVLGISIGSNDLIISNIVDFGLQAAVIASFATVGSLLVSWLVYRSFFKNGKEGNGYGK